MSRNRVKPANSLQIHKVWKLITVMLVLTICGLVYVYLQVKNGRLAKDIERKEGEFKQLVEESGRRALEFRKLTDPSVLRRRVAVVYPDMVESNRLTEIDAQSFHGSGKMVARSRDYPQSVSGGN
ncbi:MAG: hypothetical protein LBD30_03910 [Verrucomicrobiales bacterium]|jgi:hypothetical protein|nr:hypothetical protein [Verrucomicrobiales bacterium]